MKKGASVTKDQLDSALLDTQKELARAGFWVEGSRILQTEVYWCRFPQFAAHDALGFFFHSTGRLHSMLGFEPGHIYIPKWVLVHGPWQQRGSLRDVVRHEYAHAVAHYYPGLLQQGPRFREVFGGDYFDAGFSDGWESACVSAYATTRPMEDFAETFMLFLRTEGCMPERFSTPSIRKKWKFIRDLGRVVASGGGRW
jgi:hypothetical protein